MSGRASVRLLTPGGIAGIAVLELTGGSAEEVLRKCFRPARADATLEHGRLYYGHMLRGAEVLDEVIVARAPTRTGECVFEVNCHGGMIPARRLMEHLVELGASGAAASGRALGVILRKLERQLLDQLIHAHTRRAAEVLLVQLSGRLREELGRIGSLAAPAEMRGALDQLRATYSYGRRLAEPSAVVITGAPNVGKSALANALVGRERSIVHHLPGTTRDAVTAVASFDGLPVTVVDTAGLRQAADEIERLGVGRALEKASSCDLVVWVFDHSRAVSRDEAGYLQLLPRSRLVPVVNKIDLEGPTGDDEIRDMLGMEALRTSAVTGSGIEELRTRICTCLVGTDVPARDAAVVTLSSVDSVLAEAAHALKSGETLKPLLEGILAD